MRFGVENRWSHILCRGQAESDVTVMPSVVCGLCWWYNHGVVVVPPSMALAFVTKMSKKRTSTSPSTIQVKQWWKTVSTEAKLRHNKPTLKRWRNCWHIGNVRHTHISIHTIRDNADTITESAKSGKVFV